MKILKWVLIVVLIIVVAAVGYLGYLGAFSPVKVYEAKMGPFTIAYKSFVGPYSKTGAVFTEVYNELKSAEIVTTRGLGIYYDDPKNTPESKLRSDCGSIIESIDSAKLGAVKNKLEIKTIPQSDCVVVEFPLRNMLSFIIGPMKAYPALTEYAVKKNYKVLMTYELYDEANGKIFFVMPVGK